MTGAFVLMRKSDEEFVFITKILWEETIVE
jgi:hypothetical protein